MWQGRRKLWSRREEGTREDKGGHERNRRSAEGRIHGQEDVVWSRSGVGGYGRRKLLRSGREDEGRHDRDRISAGRRMHRKTWHGVGMRKVI